MQNRVLLFGAAAAVIAVGVFTSARAASFPDPPKASAASSGTDSIVLAGGCFWGMQGIFEHMKGVTHTVVGYAGGKKETAHYERIEEGDTNHAESVQITYDPSKITYGDLLKVYFSVAHDPTTLNRQHYDSGTQYRSSIFYSTEEQKTVAEQYIHELDAAHVFRDPIVTKVVPLPAFYPAEGYHQHYLDQVVACDTTPLLQRCGALNAGYIKGVDVPLLKNFQAKYPDLYVKEIR
jgi:peptide-methionine (S)-S-oxide reductase